MKRVFIIHGWEGKPSSDWYPWLKKELIKKGFKVIAPSMPNTDEPKISVWVPFLKKQVGKLNKDTYFVGHSIGCQTILRYLEKEKGKAGGCLFVAGWFRLTKETLEEPGTEEVARPWIKNSIDFKKVLRNTKKFTAIFSSNDPFVPLNDSKLFKKRLRAKVIIEKNKGHFNGKKYKEILDEFLKLAR